MAAILLVFVAYRFYKIRDNTGENKRMGPSLLYVTMEIGFFNLGVGLLALI